MSHYDTNLSHKLTHLRWKHFHLDAPLLCGLLLLLSCGFILLYSVSNQSSALLQRQLLHIACAILLMLVLVQIPPRIYYKWTPWFFTASVGLLILVLLMGIIGKGAQRWLNLGFIYFEPSELMKVAMPMMLAWYLHERHLPPTPRMLFVCGLLILVPVLLVAKQPDLGTALIIAATGGLVLLLAGISNRLLAALALTGIGSIPLLWHFMRDYQRERVLVFLSPEREPLGNGYHIIQSKIAIGSGGLWGKGWLHSTQAPLQFLPEHTTDFIFAVYGEEFGLLGTVLLVLLILLISLRCLYISIHAQTTFTRLLAGSLSLTFFMSAFINIGMVSGILPVVGVPLPLISYGGTNMIITLISFGIIMAIHTHRKLF